MGTNARPARVCGLVFAWNLDWVISYPKFSLDTTKPIKTAFLLLPHCDLTCSLEGCGWTLLLEYT